MGGQGHPQPKGVLPGIGQTILHNVESSLVQARLIEKLNSQVL